MPTAAEILAGHARQVHLDFHNSPYIPDIGSEFDADAFAATLRDAHVNSINLFAKCHHGMCYYPTRVGVQHPALKGRDLLGEQIEACHRLGIRCPIYVTVGWEEDAAAKHPEWRQIKSDFTFANVETSTDERTRQPGGWKYLNYLHREYQDYIEAHVRELMDAYDVDGFWFDILQWHRDACWSDASMAFRAKHGLTGNDAPTRARFIAAAQQDFGSRINALIQGRLPEATIYYNATNEAYVTRSVGVGARQNLQTQVEIESLPSGFWGYHHFPRLARLAMAWAVPWLGMTGRFQRQWGDFGGIKPQAALEYECFRSQALGGANSVGDQLPPRGVLDPAAYRLIGSVFRQCAEAEPFYTGSEPVPQVGIVHPNHPILDERQADETIEGAIQMCDTLHYDAAVLDESADLSRYDLLLLPDTATITEPMREKLLAYWSAGGRVILSYRGGEDEQGAAVLPLPMERKGEAGLRFPTYWRFRDGLLPDAEGDRVVYSRGWNVRPGQGAAVLADRVLPYFHRTDVHFSSHFQTPPVAEPDEHPAIIGGERFVYFADPVFREYRSWGSLHLLDAVGAAMRRLIGEPMVGAGLPGTVLLTPRRRGEDLLLTLLHYIPARNALKIDTIQEPSTFAGERLRLARPADRLEIFGGGTIRPDADGTFPLPPVRGRLLLTAPGWFA